MNKKAITLLIHIPIWIVVSYFIFNSNRELGTTTFQITSSVLNISWIVGTFYFYFSFLVPRFLEKKKHILFALFSILFIGIIPFIIIALDTANLYLFGDQEKISIYRLRSYGISLLGWSGGAQGSLFIALLGSIYRFITDWFKNIDEKKDLKSKNLQSELMLLKSKLNPHLLFNTLNNIDTLIQTSPKRASELLSKLSDLLRYVVYNTEKEKIPLNIEINNLKKYIDLEKIRLVNPDSVTFTTEIEENTFIPPMIFFPFVENGFKHSNLNNRNHKLRISISDTNGVIKFECVNNVIEKPQNSDYNGIGLELARKRLELLFPNKHELTAQQQGNEFIVKLRISMI